MNDASTNTSQRGVTVGLDLGDAYTQLCTRWDGELIEEARLPPNPSFASPLLGDGPSRLVLEAGTHSPWVSRLLEDCGHEVYVANPRKLRLVYQNDSKSDRVDAQYLARIGRLDPALLAPLRHRRAATQVDLALIRSRDVLVRARVQLINHVRGTVKSVGGRLLKCSTESFAGKPGPASPLSLGPPLLPAHDREVRDEIRALDPKIEEIAGSATRRPRC